MLIGQATQAAHIGETPIQVDGNDRASPRADCRLDGDRVDVEGVRIWLHQDGHQPRLTDGQSGSDEAVVGQDHLVPFLQAAQLQVAAQHQGQGIQTVAYSDRIADAAGVGVFAFESGDLGAQYVPAGAQHPLKGFGQGAFIAPIESSQIEERKHVIHPDNARYVQDCPPPELGQVHRE